MDFDFITIGDYSLDVILQIASDKANVKYLQQNSEISLSREDKILVDEMNYSIGGNSCNVAVGLSRLGMRVSYQTFYGTEWWRDRFIDEMKKENIDLSLASLINTPAGNYSTSLFFQNEKTILVHNHANRYQLDERIINCKYIYVSSVGPDFAEYFEQLANFVYQNKKMLIFNPASHQFEKTISYYKNILAVSEILFVNKKEAKKILSTSEDDVKTLLGKLLDFGAKKIVLTDQTNGAYYFDGEKFLFCPIYPMEVKQKTGAGDAFASGFLAGYYLYNSPSEALKWGTINSAFVISQTGPHQGLLTREKMEEEVKLATYLNVENCN